MSFQSLNFIFIFLPLTLAVFAFIKRVRPAFAGHFLVAASMLFCGLNDNRAVIILLASIVINYTLARCIETHIDKKAYKDRYLFTGIALNLIVLFIYKFLSSPIHSVMTRDRATEDLIFEFGIPLGLSFYTLYQISFLVDVYKGKAQVCGILPYSLSVSMFSQLPAGPILNYRGYIAQFTDLAKNRFSVEKIGQGLSLFTFGLFKKTLLADPLAIFTDQMYKSINSGSVLTLWQSLATVWSFLLQIYFDFSAYSDMAIGLGLCFGLNLPVNFNSPLKARTAIDYINRWHISLINFNREYVYLPASRYIAKKLKGSPFFRHYTAGLLAMFLVYISVGFWHAPTVLFLLSGVMIGLLLTLAQLLTTITTNRFGTISLRSLGLLGVTINRLRFLFLAAVFASLLRLDSIAALECLLKGFVNFDGFGQLVRSGENAPVFRMITEPVSFFGYRSLTVPLPLFMLICTSLAVLGPNSMEIFGIIRTEAADAGLFFRWKPNLAWGIAVGIALALYFLIGQDEPVAPGFLYGEF